MKEEIIKEKRIEIKWLGVRPIREEGIECLIRDKLEWTFRFLYAYI